MYQLLADLIVVIHIAYVLYVVGGLVAILIGVWRGRGWIRNPWFRVTHLLAILIVAMECILKLNCPLTIWENSARTAAQQPADGSAFMDRLLSFILIGSAPRWLINGMYFVFAIAIAATFILARPRWNFGTGRREMSAGQKSEARSQ
jgi:hypothetical protein